MQPTRKGNSVAVDTSPDLTLTGSGTSATWCNTNEDLGSDHKIIEVVVEGGPATPRKQRVEAVNWDSFRDLRDDPTPICHIAEWCDGVLRTVKAATEVVETEGDNEVVDRRLVNLWRKKKGLENRLQRRRWDRNIRKQIAALNRQIEEHAITLTKQNWGNVCQEMDRNMSTAGTWRLLRHLLDPDSTKAASKQQLERMAHQFDGSKKELLEEVRKRYINPAGSEPLPDYGGRESSALDAPISLAEPEVGIHLYINGAEIPAVDSIRVLGLRIQANRKNHEMLARLEASSNQTCRLIRRIANRHAGMKEANLLRLVQTFIISRIVYVAPYLKLNQAERNKLDTIIRKSVKVALGLPPNTSTDRFMKLGVSNTLDELIEATVTAQHQRLLGSKTGRAILERLGYEPKREQVRSKDIPGQIRDRINIPPLPRNMNPAFHEGRRKARAEALQAKYTGRQDVLYTDAAEYENKAAHTAVAVRDNGALMACCTVSGVETVEAEEVAIALAISQKGVRVVISDSKNAVRNYESGRVTETAVPRRVCLEPFVSCADQSSCVLKKKFCDGKFDCKDHSDELGCTKCAPPLIKCATVNRCIDKAAVCNGINECEDRSDEQNCPDSSDCRSREFTCKSGHECIPMRWVCDGSEDCEDGSDEEMCHDKGNNLPFRSAGSFIPGKTGEPSEPVEYEDVDDEKFHEEEADSALHTDGKKGQHRVVEGNAEEDDISDPPKFKTATYRPEPCKADQFRCMDNGECIPMKWKCDGNEDCTDGSDEKKCTAGEGEGMRLADKRVNERADAFTVSPVNSFPLLINKLFLIYICAEKVCEPAEFYATCGDGVTCIPKTSVCDGVADCPDRFDESNCCEYTKQFPDCPADYFKCKTNGKCIMNILVCDDEDDCNDGSDEKNCVKQCPPTHFQCESDKTCIKRIFRCDGDVDCEDASDEKNCPVGGPGGGGH
ncbi:hypothetical protein HPB52_017497 [Rhipicephalus sanguineus]|uniref:Uncharacterized protein n=1 Tax=Rhipicephalus sanguineus TaxID=34632 RepID=A0A9D4Q7M3_RHISA|nr:hypothetical protein HPB52_017497 [Rhipicephalus sanguineus]